MQITIKNFSPELQNACIDVVQCKNKIHAIIDKLKTYNSELQTIFSIGFGQMMGEHRIMGSIELFYLSTSPFEVQDFDDSENPERQLSILEKIKKIEKLIESELLEINRINLRDIPALVTKIKNLTGRLEDDRGESLKMTLSIIDPVVVSTTELKSQMQKFIESIELITKIINEKIQQFDEEEILIEIFMSMLLEFHSVMGKIPTEIKQPSVDAKPKQPLEAWVEISKEQSTSNCCLVM
jgi:hypothetical protein